MPQIPHDPSPDSTLAFRRDPYGFISERCRRLGSDLFEARILLRPTICMMGREAAELFYDRERFRRRDATPSPIQKTLFGRGGVQTLDGESHRHRKAMLISVVTTERVRALAGEVNGWWETYVERWAALPAVVLYDELHELLCRAACAWAGVPLPEREVERRTRELSALFDYAGSVGPKHWWARIARRRADRWMAGVVEGIRAGRIEPPEGSPVRIVAGHRRPDGEPLDARVAAVEMLNVLRPTIAVSVYITFAALALHRHPRWSGELADGGPEHAESFVQEVRRYYPFFPAIGAVARRDFVWRGYPFPEGRRVLLDLYGTNHDPGVWQEPDEFRPERFREREIGPFELVPQGGGDPRTNHRCPGERITIELMKVALGWLAGGMSYRVPDQDLRIDTQRLPALPNSRFVIADVRAGRAG